MQDSYSMKYKNHSLNADNQLRKKIILIFHVFRTLGLFPKSSDAVIFLKESKGIFFTVFAYIEQTY